LRLCLLASAASVALLSVMPSYPLWLLLRLLIGISLTVVFVLGESWINQLVEDRLRGRLVALYGTGFALSQLSGPLLLTVLGTDSDRGFWLSAALLVAGSVLLLGRGGAPTVDAHSASGRGIVEFCRTSPAIAWAVVLFAAFEAMVLTLLPVYLVREGFVQQMALIMVSLVVIGDAALQLPIGWLADRVPRQTLFRCCGVVLLLSSLSMPSLLHTPLIWGVLVLFGASAGGLYTLSLILVGQRYRDDALVRANSHIALLWGAGCLLGPLSTGAASQWVSGHALPMLMALGAAGFVWLAYRRGAFAEPPAPAAIQP
jgi:MFS family permease